MKTGEQAVNLAVAVAVFGAVLMWAPTETAAECGSDAWDQMRQCGQSFTKGIPETFGYRGPDANFGSSNDDKARGIGGRVKECVNCVFEGMRRDSTQSYQPQRYTAPRSTAPSSTAPRSTTPRYYSTPSSGGARH
jgi:hypothetical protein